MKVSYLIAALVAATMVTPALSAEQYYIVRDTMTKKCTIVSKMPMTTSMVAVENGVAYTSKTEAEAALKNAKVCAET